MSIVSVDLDTPQALAAAHFMRRKGLGYIPESVEQLDDQPCWYFYYTLPEGHLELEVSWDDGEWNVMVTTFNRKQERAGWDWLDTPVRHR